MKFKIDQNLPAECVDLLRRAGHDALTVWQQDLGGAPDPRIVAVCQEEARALLTADLDLSDIRRYPPEDSPGFIILRLKEQTRPNQLDLLERILPMFDTHPVAGRLWIVEATQVRIRGGPQAED
jgi:predicted nuclease of predicted toxin-antitoxin system